MSFLWGQIYVLLYLMHFVLSVCGNEITKNGADFIEPDSYIAERTVDLTLTSPIIGVDIDFRYNETLNTKDDRIPSAAGCPKSHAGYPWLYYGDPPRCFIVGTQGPCLPGQLLFGNISSKYGICDCHCPANVSIKNNTTDPYGVALLKFPRYIFCSMKEIMEINEIAIDVENGTSIFLETQGFCNENEWVVKDETGEGLTCVPQCSQVSGVLSNFTFDYNDRKCIQKPLYTVFPIALPSTISQQSCEDEAVYSKLLCKCIPKAKAYIMRF